MCDSHNNGLKEQFTVICYIGCCCCCDVKVYSSMVFLTRWFSPIMQFWPEMDYFVFIHTVFSSWVFVLRVQIKLEMKGILIFKAHSVWV